MHGPDGKVYLNESLFAEIDPQKKVVIDHISKPKYRLIFTFAPLAEGTVLSWSPEFEEAKFAANKELCLLTANVQNLDRLPEGRCSHRYSCDCRNVPSRE